MLSHAPTAETALTMHLESLQPYWLEVHCDCPEPRRVRVLGILYRAERRPLGNAIGRMRCDRCGSKPREVWLCETSIRVRVGFGMQPGWSVRVL